MQSGLRPDSQPAGGLRALTFPSLYVLLSGIPTVEKKNHHSLVEARHDSTHLYASMTVWGTRSVRRDGGPQLEALTCDRWQVFTNAPFHLAANTVLGWELRDVWTIVRQQSSL
jgi:hypothetical protein